MTSADLGEESELSALDTSDVDKVEPYVDPFSSNISNTL
jgi:hypothetical protein